MLNDVNSSFPEGCHLTEQKITGLHETSELYNKIIYIVKDTNYKSHTGPHTYEQSATNN